MYLLQRAIFFYCSTVQTLLFLQPTERFVASQPRVESREPVTLGFPQLTRCTLTAKLESRQPVTLGLLQLTRRTLTAKLEFRELVTLGSNAAGGSLDWDHKGICFVSSCFQPLLVQPLDTDGPADWTALPSARGPRDSTSGV